jgi:transposase
LIPKKSGDRIKNDRRDARNLARLHRAGELTRVYVPTQEDEAMRDLTRAREDARIVSRKAKQRLNSFLLRNGYDFSGKTRWSKAFFGWLADIRMSHSAQQVTLQEYIDAVHQALGRVDRLTDQIRNLVTEWHMAPVVQVLQACRGVSLITAATFVAELGDLQRFKSPRMLMAYLGLTPSEYSSGDHCRRGAITKTGNSHVRRVLVEAAWTYRFPARQTRYLLRRQRGLSDDVRQIAWKAQLRLCLRYRQLSARGKRVQIVVTAVARELIGFLWAIWHQVPLTAK